MASWSRQRKSIYGLAAVIIILGLVVIPSFLYLYHAPTCFDGAKNGSEQGVDCGGACSRLCQSSFLPPDVAWTRFEEVAPGLYNMAAYIVNPNTEGEADAVPYHIALYDDQGVLITDTRGVVTLPPHRNTLAFQGSISAGKRVPTKALFEFTAAPNWYKQTDLLSKIVISDKSYTEDDSGSYLSVKLLNKDVQPMENVSVYTVLYDKDGNALGFSKTAIDEIAPGDSQIAPFTWPLNRNGAVISIEVLPVKEGK